MSYTVSEKRMKEWKSETGVFVRAMNPETGEWLSADIAHLDRESLLAWLRSRDGDNPYAEDVVGILLGHGHLHPVKP